MAHTPGPWFALLGQFDFGNDGSRRIMRGTPDDDFYKRIGTVDPVLDRKERGKNRTPYDAPDAERDANARLFAAAPDLLAACEAAAAACSLQALRDRSDIPTHKGWLKLESDIRAAIAKAKA